MHKKTAKKILAGIGNPILDISNHTTKEVIDKFGLVYNQTIFANDSNVGFYDVLETTPKCSYIAGGSVTNTIRVANWMINGNPDLGCYLIGCIGKDEYGSKIKSELEKVGVEPILEESEKELTSRCACGIIGNARCLLPEIRASSKLSKSFVEINIEKILEAEILFIEGYFLIDCWDIVKLLYSSFEMAEKKIGFTLSAVFMIENFFDKIKEVANASDFIFANEDEAQAYVKMLGQEASLSNAENSKIIHRSLDKDENRIIIFTHGSLPTTVSTWDYEKDQFKQLLEVPVYPIDKVEDTNGCGDSLCGGFMAEYMKGSDLLTCVKAGQYAASIIIQNVGCTYPKVPEFTLPKNS